jgi:hypothetical protein
MNKNTHTQIYIMTKKYVLIHSRLQYILSEFGHFHLVKLFNPLVIRDQMRYAIDKCYNSLVKYKFIKPFTC